MAQIKLLIFMLNILVYVHVHALRFVEKDLQKPYVQARTSSGIVQGIRLRSEILRNGYYYAFLGIPYAQPPLGNLRFKAPVWVSNWSGVLDGGREGNKCVEIYLEVKERSRVTGTEDCLFLNVFTETNPRYTNRLKPVMVYIHGGAFWQGSSDLKKLGPDLLVSRGVLVVTFNYRLSVFGFLNSEDMASPGNYGLKDQNLVLRWIQKNIRNFGGDPDNVLLFGQSAGAASVNFHMLSPKSRGLFHKAIMQSGSALCLWGSQRKPRNIAYLFGIANGITNPRDSEDLIERLRKINLEDLKETLLPVLASSISQVTLTGLPFSPSFEHDHEEAFLTKNNWFEMLKNGDFNQVPVLMGINKNESLYFLQELKLFKPAFIFFDLDHGLLVPLAMNITDEDLMTYLGGKIKERYIGKSSTIFLADIESLLRYVSHDNYVRPLWKTAELMSKHVPLYFYQFRYESELGRNGLGSYRQYPGIKGVGHEEELAFIFNEMNNTPKTDVDVLIRKRILTIWTNFAKFSNPTPVERNESDVLEHLAWPLFASARNSTNKFLVINEPMKISNISEDHVDVEWWDDLFEKYGNPPYNTY